MDDLHQYFTLQNRIDELEKQNAKLQRELTNARKNASKWKCKYEKIAPPPKKRERLLKNQRAYELIAQREAGEIAMSLVDIGRECGVNYGTLKHMAYEYRQLLNK